MNSRAKGARGERQWRDELRANGYAARRGQQFSGSAESPDVVCPDLDFIHWEVKAVEKLNIEDAMEQARKDCGARNAERGLEGHLTAALSPKGGEGELAPARKVPIVAHKRNHRRWLVTMEAETLFKLLRGDLPGSGNTSPRPNDSAAPASSALGGPSPGANSFRQFPTGSSPQRGEGEDFGTRGSASLAHTKTKHRQSL